MSNSFLNLFIGILIINIQIQTIEAFEWPASPLDPDSDGDCPSFTIQCMPYEKLSFKEEVWQGKSEDHWIQELNRVLKEGNVLYKKMYIRNSLESQFTDQKGIFFGEKVRKGEVLGEITPKKIISSELNVEAFKGKPYYAEHRKIFKGFKWYGNSDAVLRLTLNLLYHLYHIEDSPVASDLRALPQKMNMFGFSATRYELETMLKDDVSSSFINNIRNRTMYEHLYLNKFLEKHLSKKERMSLLNGRELVPADDYVYATSVIYQRSVSDNLKIEEDIKYFYFIPFATHYAKLRDQNLPDGGYVQSHIDNKTGEYIVKLISNDNYEKGDEFLIDFFITENYRMLAIHGIPYIGNERECLRMKFLDEETTAKFELPSLFILLILGIACVAIFGNHLMKYYIMGDYLNMNEQEKDECEDILSEFVNDPVHRTKAFMEKCAHPVWSKVNVWTEAKEILEMYIASGKQITTMATIYISQRKEHKRSTERGKAILGYSIEKVKNANAIKGDIQFYEEIARTDVKGKIIKSKETDDEIKKEL